MEMVDQGFLRWRVPNYYLAIFSWKLDENIKKTRMYSSRMWTVRCSDHLSCMHVSPAIHTPTATMPPSHMLSAMHTPSMHAPCHACPLPWIECPLPCIPCTIHAPMPHTGPPATNHAPPPSPPPWTDRCLWKYYLGPNFVCRAVIRKYLLGCLDARAAWCESSVVAFSLHLSVKSSNEFDSSC